MTRWERGRWRGRAPLVVTVTALTAAVGVAVSGATAPGGQVDFFPSGHWVFNSVLQAVFHLDGASGTVDAQAGLPGAEPGSQVVQGETGGYVVGGNRIIEFGKSDLEVERTIAAPSPERPVALEVAGGPYLVYRQAGRIVRLGDVLTTVPTGGELGDPVATTAGSVWVQHRGDGSICELARDANRLVCPAGVPSGHTGGLTVLDDRPVFVDTTTDTVHQLGGQGLGEGTALGIDAPPDARFTATDVAGRLAVLDPPAQRVHLVDTGPAKAAPVSVDLPAGGDYAEFASAGEAVVLLDRAKNSVLTYDAQGRPKKTMPLPPGEPRLARGEDSRVYVDSHDGGHVLVVGGDGEVRPVPVGPRPERPEQPPQQGQPQQRPVPPPARPQQPVKPRPQQPEPPPVRQQQAQPASPPGAPPGVRATAGNAAITVNWGAAAPNGSPITGYHLTWTSSAGSGSKSVGGGIRSTTLGGLAGGATYVVTVTAENAAGRGPGARSAGVRPIAPQRSITLSRGAPVTNIDDCSIPECAYMHVEAAGFTPGRSYEFTAHATATSYRSPVSTRTAKADGTISFEAFHFDQIDETVWVTADGVESNRINWEKS